jgi:multidrug transporter EmrE-like cation transporter
VSATIAGIALADLSAMGSSGAHALLKAGDDKVAVQAWSSLLGLTLALPMAALVGLPEPAIIPWLAAGWALHTLYYLLLIRSDSMSDYSLAYPIARGVVPIGTTLLGIALLGDELNALAIVGVAAITVGILLLGLRGTVMSREGLAVAAVVGLVNTAFTLFDAKALRMANDFLNFLVWFLILDGLSMPVLFAAQSGTHAHSGKGQRAAWPCHRRIGAGRLCPRADRLSANGCRCRIGYPRHQPAGQHGICRPIAQCGARLAAAMRGRIGDGRCCRDHCWYIGLGMKGTN